MFTFHEVCLVSLAQRDDISLFLQQSFPDLEDKISLEKKAYKEVLLKRKWKHILFSEALIHSKIMSKLMMKIVCKWCEYNVE